MAQTPSVPDETTLRFIDLTKIGDGRYKATNRRGGVLPIGSGDDPDFSPIELCSRLSPAAAPSTST